MTSGSSDILIAGIGNILMGDDGFGVEVVRRLRARSDSNKSKNRSSNKSSNTRIVDFGIRGFDLASALAQSPNVAILIDAAQRGKIAGSVTVLEPHEMTSLSFTRDDGDAFGFTTHGMHPLRALDLARTLGGVPNVIRVVVCEPAVLGTEEEPIMGLSADVENAIPNAIAIVETLIRSFEESEQVAP